MANNRLMDPAEVQRLINQASAERARFMRTLMRRNMRRVVWTMGTLTTLYLVGLLSFHHM